MKMNSNYKPKSNMNLPPSKALAAVAFQDHLLRDLSLDDLSASFNGKKLSVSDNLRFQEKRRRIALRKTKPTIDTGLRKKTQRGKEKAINNDEYVLDPQPQPLSLAQKLGLVPHQKNQEKLLTESEWKSLKEASSKRDDFRNPCAICKDDFRMEDQVLLSCSHFFHKACLQAFERFTGRKTCPMCRHESYQTRVVHEGTKYYKQKSATKIQASWRGYVVRKWYRNLRKTIPPKDPNLRKKFYENKLSEITDRMVAMTSSDRIDRFLSDMDQSLSHSRNVFQFFEKSLLSNLTDEEWMKIEEKAVERGVTECPICLRLFELNDPSNDFGHQKYFKDQQNSLGGDGKDCSISLLSCSHVFHTTCLNALEMFFLDSAPNSLNCSSSHLSSFRCPVCRSFYLKRLFLF